MIPASRSGSATYIATHQGVIPARVAGIHFAASVNVSKARCRDAIDRAARTEKWVPVTPAFAGAGKHRDDAVVCFKAADTMGDPSVERSS